MHLVTYLHPRLPTDSAEEPDVLGADTLDLLQFLRRSIEHGGQTLELSQGCAGSVFAIGARRAEGEQQFDHLTVGKSLDTVRKKFVTQPLAVPFSFMNLASLFHNKRSESRSALSPIPAETGCWPVAGWPCRWFFS